MILGVIDYSEIWVCLRLRQASQFLKRCNRIGNIFRAVECSLQGVTGYAGRGCADADVVALELAIERGAGDAEHASGEGFVSFDLFEDALDGGALNVFEIGGCAGAVSGGSDGVGYGKIGIENTCGALDGNRGRVDFDG